MLSGDELPFERRDFIRDVEDGQYEILADNDVSPELGTLLAISSTKQVGSSDVRPSMYARILKPPVTGRDADQTTLRFSYALDIPTDIFSLGCLIGWTMTAGQENLVHLVREQANVATRRRQALTGDFSARLLGEDYRKLCNSIDLPASPQDDAIKFALIDMMCRCLIRSEGGYCRQRSSGYNRPAASVVADMRRIRNALFLLFSAPGDVAHISQRHIADEASRLNSLRDLVVKLEGEATQAAAELQNREVELRSLVEQRDRGTRSLAIWRVMALLVAALGFAGILLAALRPNQSPTVAANTSREAPSLLEQPADPVIDKIEPAGPNPAVGLETEPDVSKEPIRENTILTVPTQDLVASDVEPPGPQKPAKIWVISQEGSHVESARQYLRKQGMIAIVEGTGTEVVEQSSKGWQLPGTKIVLTVNKVMPAPKPPAPMSEGGLLELMQIPSRKDASPNTDLK